MPAWFSKRCTNILVIFKLCYNSCLQHKEITRYALIMYAPVAKNMSKRCWSMYHNFWIQISVYVDAILLKRYALLKMGSEFKLANIFHYYSLFKGTRKGFDYKINPSWIQNILHKWKISFFASKKKSLHQKT